MYQKYYGFSETPPYTEVEWDEKMERELIDKINRVPFESEASDKGTAFNEIIDCIVENRKSTIMEVTVNRELGIIYVSYNSHLFEFSIELCKEFANYFNGTLTQQRVSDVIQTCYGLVEVYGVIDELMPFLS